MSGTKFRRKAVLLLFAALLAISAAAFAEPSRATPARGETRATLDLAGRFWHWLTGLWAEEGCILDPDGRCTPGPRDGASSTNHGNAGCILDPNGICGS